MTDHAEHGVGITVIVPLLNEEPNLRLLYDRLLTALTAYGESFELLFVDDGSTDGSFDILKGLHQADERVRIVRFFRNFGQQAAIQAGFLYARGKTIVLIDADLQTLPEEIPLLVDKLKEGYTIVYGIRQRRRDPLIRRVGSWVMANLLYRITGINIPDAASGFIALDRTLVDNLNLIGERSRYFSGLFAWLSYGRWAAVPVSHGPRHAGQTKYTIRKLVHITLDFVCNFSELPLKFASYAGLLLLGISGVAFLALLAGAAAGLEAAWVQTGLIIDALAFFSGLQLVFMGILGEYLARVYIEAKGRPTFLVSEVVGTPSEPVVSP